MKRKRTLLTIITTLFVSFVFGQEFLGQTKNEIKAKIQRGLDSTEKISFTEKIVQIEGYEDSKDTITNYDTIANLNVSLDGIEKIEMEYFFDKSGAFDHPCDSIVLKFYCSKCADNHINEFLADKYRKWKQLGTDIYISRTQTDKSTTNDKITLEKITTVGSPQMVIKRTPDQPICVTVFFSIPMMDKEKWKQLIKK